MTANRQRIERRRILHNGVPQWCLVDGDVLRCTDGSFLAAGEAMHLPPCAPTKIICVHLNYDSRRVEFRVPEPEVTPSYFFKPPSSLTSHGAPVFRPRGCEYLNYEGEVGVVIGRELRAVSEEDAWSGIAGFTPTNDVGCHDFRGTDRGSMMRVKGLDGFCPVGPGLVTGIDIRESILRTHVNGKVVQETSVAEMSFSIGYLIADLSRYMTLYPGDLILSGTPENSRPMKVGDVVEVEVTEVGRLRNVIHESPIRPLDVGFQPTVTEETRKVALGSDFYR